MTIAIVDYGAGNIQSVVNAFDELGESVLIANQPSDLAGAERIILPGVGAMIPAMERLRSSGLADALNNMVMEEGVPFLGICLGMQLMCKVGKEGGYVEGLGWVEGEVNSLEASPPDWRVPHMGWAEIEDRENVPLFDRLQCNAAFYFCHSFVANASDVSVAGRVAFAENKIPAVLWRGNAIGVQFHPERSGNNGLRMLENFVTWDGQGRSW